MSDPHDVPPSSSSSPLIGLSKAFARTLKDIKHEFESDNVRRLQIRLGLNAANLKKFSSKLEVISRKQGNVSSHLLKQQSKSHVQSEQPGLTAAYRVHAPRFDGRASTEKWCNEEVDYLAADGNVIHLTSKQHIKLDAVQNVPPYISWVFVQKNEFITEDIPVIRTPRVFYDEENCALVDLTETVRRPKEDPPIHFNKLDDCVILKMIQKHGLGLEVLRELATILNKSCDEVKARYDEIEARKEDPSLSKSSTISNSSTSRSWKAIPSLSSKFVKSTIDERNETPDADTIKSLAQAMDAFECLFCRRCLVFDCVLHGCSQELALPNEAPRSWQPANEERLRPCGAHCVFGLTDSICPASGVVGERTPLRDSPVEIAGNERKFRPESPQQAVELGEGRDKVVDVCSKMIEDKIPENEDNQQKDPVSNAEDEFVHLAEEQASFSGNQGMQSMHGKDLKDQELAMQIGCASNPGDVTSWTNLEKGLFEKGLHIFGKNSCLIARNLLKGFKTCIEVANFMTRDEGCMDAGGSAVQLTPTEWLSKKFASHGVIACKGCESHRLFEEHGSHKFDEFSHQEVENRARNGGGRRKSRSGRKGTGSMTNALRQRLSDLAKRDVYTNYNPCGCFPACGKDCPCKLNSTCCEKICGCASSCKYRFRGCNCAKGHCSTRNCPCFAASRECDPDVCRKCWISCGDNSIAGPPQREDICDCHNMPLFLGQKQRVLLGRSSIVGWGAFLKNPVEKNTFLGEYTGELITHDEAERRGRKYDHEGRSYLFNLNNEFCIDAYRKGDKLKFANHSSHPNCFAKIVLVSGDHRVAIFSKERIGAGEELFYDYDYAPESCPDWAVKVNEEEMRQSRQYRANSKFARKAQQSRRLKKPVRKPSAFEALGGLFLTSR